AGLRRSRLVRSDVVVLEHALDDVVAPRLRRLGEALRAIVVGRLGKAGEKGGLADGEVVERLAEILQRWRGGARKHAPAVDLVEIELEDAVLGESLLDLHGEQRLLHLALERDFAG